MSDTALTSFASPEVADDYEAYIRKFKDSIDGIIEKMNVLADNIDQKSENKFTRGFKNYIDTISAEALHSAKKTKEITDDCVRILSSKNDALEDPHQEEYLQQIGNAANGLDDVLPYKGCELGGVAPLTDELLEKMFHDFTVAGQEWEDRLKELSNDASSLADNMVQDEMTNVYHKISSQINNIISIIEETLEKVVNQSMDLVEATFSGKVQSENNAEEKAQEAMQQFQQKMEDAMSDLDGLELY